MLKNFEPNKVFSLTSKAPKYILLIFIIVISIGLLEALIFSPGPGKPSESGLMPKIIKHQLAFINS